MEISKPMCSITVPMETGDVIDWYFTRTTTESATRIVIDGSKYRVARWRIISNSYCKQCQLK